MHGLTGRVLARRIAEFSGLLLASFLCAAAQTTTNVPNTATAGQVSPDASTVWAASPALLSVTAPKVDVILTAPKDVCANPSFNPGLDKATVRAQAGLGIMVASTKHSGKCELTATLAPGSNPVPGMVRLSISETASGSDGSTDIGQSTISVGVQPPGPIPPGLDQQVDATWQVEDYDVVRQNFGKDLAQHYLMILVKIGNNTGYTLLLDGVAFQLAGMNVPPCNSQPGCDNVPNPVPSETPLLLQGVVAYGENYSARNIIWRSMQWASLLTTGFIPFFKAPVAAANYSSAIAIFNGPFLNGYSQQFLDLTVQQLERLNRNGILGDSNEIDNNSTAVYLAFLPRRSICERHEKDPVVNGACGPSPGKMEPAAMTRVLKQLVLVGVKIPAANARFRVVASSGTPSTQITTDRSAVAGAPTTITVSAPFDLTGATVEQNNPDAPKPTISPGPTQLSVQITLTAETTQPFHLQLQLKDGSALSVPITVTLPTLQIDHASIAKGPNAVPSKITCAVNCIGLSLPGATVNSSNSSGLQLPASPTLGADGSISVTPLAPGSYTLHVIPVGFVAGDPGIPVSVTVTP